MTDPNEGSVRPGHTCLLVEDLESSIADLTATTGKSFDAVHTVELRMVNQAVDSVHPVRFAYSTDGTVEVAAGGPGGAFGPGVARGVHHLGRVAERGLDHELDRFLAAGELIDWKIYVEDALVAVLFAPSARRPVRLELLAPHPPSPAVDALVRDRPPSILQA